MYYDINISLKGKHLFATAERSVRSRFDLIRVLPVIKEKFPEDEGYKVSVTYYEENGKGFGDNDIQEVLNESAHRARR